MIGTVSINGSARKQVDTLFLYGGAFVFQFRAGFDLRDALSREFEYALYDPEGGLVYRSVNDGVDLEEMKPGEIARVTVHANVTEKKSVEYLARHGADT